MSANRKINSWDDLVKFFESRIDKTTSPKGCWIYTGNLDCYGYGRIHAKGIGISIKTHRLSWKIYRGDITPKEFMCHKCDNPPCCNPDHLFIGDNSDNFKDMWKKGRGSVRHGEKCPTAKVCEADVIEIRRLWNKGGITQQKIGDMFGLNQGTVSQIVHGKRWAYLNEQKTTPRP